MYNISKPKGLFIVDAAARSRIADQSSDFYYYFCVLCISCILLIIFVYVFSCIYWLLILFVY